MQNKGMVDTEDMPQKPYAEAIPALESVSSFAEWVTKLTAKGTGVTQRALAKVAGITPQGVHNWKSGKGPNSIPGPDKIARICKWTGVDYDDLQRLANAQKISKSVPMVRISTMDSFSGETKTIHITVPKTLSEDGRKQLEKIARVLEAEDRK